MTKNKKMLPSIKIYNVDYSFIISNYLNKELWNKTWTLFNYKYTTASLCLDSINTKNKIINFEVRVDWSDGIKNDYSLTTISYQLGVTTIEQLKNIINNAIWNRILKIEENLIEHTEIYQDINKNWRYERDLLREIAENFLNSEGVTNSDIRDAYIDAYIDKNDKTWEMLIEYKQQMQYRILTDLFLIFANSIKDENKKEYVIKNQKGNIQELLKEISKLKIQFDEEDYIEEMKDSLPEIF